jgi:hypothetical protein
MYTREDRRYNSRSFSPMKPVVGCGRACVSTVPEHYLSRHRERSVITRQTDAQPRLPFRWQADLRTVLFTTRVKLRRRRVTRPPESVHDMPRSVSLRSVCEAHVAPVFVSPWEIYRISARKLRYVSLHVSADHRTWMNSCKDVVVSGVEWVLHSPTFCSALAVRGSHTLRSLCGRRGSV